MDIGWTPLRAGRLRPCGDSRRRPGTPEGNCAAAI